MTGDPAPDPVTALLLDLDQQADGLHLAEREALAADLARAQYAEVTLAARLHAAPGLQVAVRVSGGGRLAGAVERVGDGWLTLASDHPAGRTRWIVLTDALVAIEGLPAESVPAVARPVDGRLSVRSALRNQVEPGADVAIRLRDGDTTTGPLRLVGADFLEIGGVGRSVAITVPFAAVAAIGVGRG